MPENKLHKFLEGELSLEQLKQEKNSVESNFIDSYQKLVERSKTEVPEFDPFEKVAKTKRFSFAKRILPYAATVLLVVISIVFYNYLISSKTELAQSEQELKELQENTTMALLYFSKELNACMEKFNDVKQFQQPANEIQQLKNIKLKTDNPFKNIKIDKL